MSPQVETHAGAVGLGVGFGVPVQLRLSVVDRLWVAARWVLWLAGLGVGLWFGAAFLAASPASAAVPASVVSQGLVKGGNSRSAAPKKGDPEPKLVDASA